MEIFFLSKLSNGFLIFREKKLFKYIIQHLSTDLTVLYFENLLKM
jgi:hypothetical protein